METAVKQLRNGQKVVIFDHKEKLFTAIQINKKENRVCFQRFVSKDRINWTEWNRYLTLKDCNQILETIKTNNTQWKTA